MNNLLETEIAAHSFAKKKIEEEFDKLLKRKRKSKLISMFYTPKYELIFPKGSNCNIFCRNVNYSVTNNQIKPSQHQQQAFVTKTQFRGNSQWIQIRILTFFLTPAYDIVLIFFIQKI